MFVSIIVVCLCAIDIDGLRACCVIWSTEGAARIVFPLTALKNLGDSPVYLRRSGKCLIALTKGKIKTCCDIFAS